MLFCFTDVTNTHNVIVKHGQNYADVLFIETAIKETEKFDSNID